ncbi:hypothetical protein NHH03_01015 [Stieleria sp. TO1_6]|uniref:hypothetical protein n=1 Tax=Stieleria tagensis TaxID=2956795 RepID=UPI00209B4394|nr:hypothetical protein [Stieleria tagensis]MCO8120297.1 hypothetical protein [Stieleria tagensis]
MKCFARSFAICSTLIVGIHFSLPTQLCAQSDRAATDGAPGMQLLRDAYRGHAAELEFLLADSDTKISVQEKPILSWNSLGGWSGDLFVYTAQGRIQLVGCLGSQLQETGDIQFFQEFHSFADQPIHDVALGDSQTWQIPTNVPPIKLIEDAPTPANSAPRRLVQMRGLARSFSLGMQVTDSNVENQLRLLPQPIARQSTDTGDVIESALFAFVSSAGTDPEALLLIEARRIEDQLQWTYSIGRFTTREIWMSYHQQEIWRVPADNRPPTGLIRAPYFYRNQSRSNLSALKRAAD